MQARFIGAIDQFRRHSTGFNTNVHFAARAAMSFFNGNDLHKFVIGLLNNDIF